MELELIRFIAEAKKQTYASLDSRPKETKDGGKTYSLKEGKYAYTDTYFGNLIDSGQERVYLNGKVVWVMSYRGGIYDKYQSLHLEAFNFLRICISKMPRDFPVRGPRRLIMGSWRYENKWKGDIKGFIGEENIYFKGKKICFRNYVGGLIKNK